MVCNEGALLFAGRADSVLSDIPVAMVGRGGNLGLFSLATDVFDTGDTDLSIASEAAGKNKFETVEAHGKSSPFAN